MISASSPSGVVPRGRRHYAPRIPLSNPRIRRSAFPTYRFHDAMTNERQDERGHQNHEQ
jgi:hypothetical protein